MLKRLFFATKNYWVESFSSREFDSTYGFEIESKRNEMDQNPNLNGTIF